jgi:hypothetical protein
MLLPPGDVAVYSMDTSCLIDLDNRYPSRVSPALWGIIRQLADEARLFVCRQVQDEVDGAHHPEVLGLLSDFGQVLVDLADFEPHFRALVAFVAASQITLTKPSAERTEADPFVIALALHLAGRNPRDLGTPRPAAREAVVVTDESVASSKKIPAVCRALNLPCCSLVRLLEREDYRG